MLIFTLHMTPEPEKQTRFHCVNGRPIAYNPNKKTIDLIQWQLKAYAPKEPLLGPVEVQYDFFMPMPKSSKIKQRQMLNGTICHMKKPDLSNLMYIVENAMKMIIYRDDAQIIRFTATKQYSDNPRIVIKVLEVNPFNEVV